MKRVTSGGSIPRTLSAQSMQRTTSLERLEELVQLGEELSRDKKAAPVPNSEEVSLTHLDHYAVTLAGRQRVTTKQVIRGKTILIQRLESNVTILNQAYHLVTEAIMLGRRIGSAEEWLADNYWMISEQVHMTKKHLPPGYSKEMATLENTEGMHFSTF